MRLQDLQRSFLAALDGAPLPQGIAARGLRVHANNRRERLSEALRDTYARTALMLGDADFARHAGSYIAAHAPASWTLSDYGAGFPDHLDAALPGEPVVAELAWLDAGLRRAFAGRDATPLQLDRLAAEDWETVGFAFLPTLGFTRLRSNAPAIWSALAAGRPVPPAARLPTGSGVRIWRAGLDPRFATMSPRECACLDLALAGASFGEICQWLDRQLEVDDAAREAGLLLRTWVDDGLVVALREGDA
ncbi:DNA-binding domain-containing protein [Coralloluteibacterium stylophorae]|uniref:DNA-binding domain-containing protein n=1 Tax=Coralloluteibacterium stylophorae TaxID=1776034 RepID=A0A8J7VSJ0_9GAMM|nr:DNA-binding domain-containing protein [Coralloluteibacterium stylophorae]MBS7456879.1 putative DNA-binding domain-containing protein [Coralloluteibacterium stylophorae]